MKAAISLLVLATFGLGAQALSLKEKQQMAAWNKDLAGKDGYSEEIKKNCGVTIPVKLDESVAAPFMAKNSSAAGYCEAIPDLIQEMCKDAAAKAEIVKKVKAVTCKAGEGKFSMSGTTLVFEMTPGFANTKDKARKFLEEHL